MGLRLMSLLMAVVVSQAAASEDEGAQENQENPMDFDRPQAGQPVENLSGH